MQFIARVVEAINDVQCSFNIQKRFTRLTISPFLSWISVWKVVQQCHINPITENTKTSWTLFIDQEQNIQNIILTENTHLFMYLFIALLLFLYFVRGSVSCLLTYGILISSMTMRKKNTLTFDPRHCVPISSAGQPPAGQQAVWSVQLRGHLAWCVLWVGSALHL